MNRNGPVILIEDDTDDEELFLELFADLGYNNEVMCFRDGQQALDFLNASNLTPFIIISDINLPKLNGFALRDKIRMDANLQVKCIPYIFFSTARDQATVVSAYSKSIQGFFVKDGKVEELKETIKFIMGYWSRCVSPNNFPATLKRVI